MGESKGNLRWLHNLMKAPWSLDAARRQCGDGVHASPLSCSLESPSTQPLARGVPIVLFPPSPGRAGEVGRGILLTNEALGFPSDMGSSGAILGKVGQLSPAPRPSIISLSSVAIQKTTTLPVGAKGHFLGH